MKIKTSIYYNDELNPGVTLVQVFNSQKDIDRLAYEFDFSAPDFSTLSDVIDEKTGRRITFERVD